KGSPVKRSKRRGYLRNVAVALGNQAANAAQAGIRNASAGQALIAALQDPEPLVRGHVAWALGQVGGATVQQALAEAAATESDALVQAELATALAGLTKN
ncbi:MAG: HEAT repeat domain-containing protein, partial [Anaerolineales bacterium]|nr:HEAT repeat domain-containing protein [Anaerolineales bacterium]